MKNANIFGGLNIHFVGIGGISMSGLAKLLMSMEAKVSGSDLVENEETRILRSMGVKINVPHSKDCITHNISLVVYTGAVSEDNEEVLCAKYKGIKTMERSEFLGLLSRVYKNVIAVSGTHGKTTTASILASILYEAGLNPTVHVGGQMLNFNSNTYIGNMEYLVLEACEYKNSFAYLTPDISIITNIESEHLDFYLDYAHLHQAFEKFADNSKYIITNKNMGIVADMVVGRDIEARNITFSHLGYNFDVYLKSEFYDTFRLNLLGVHNVENSLFAILVAIYMGIEKYKIIRGVGNFKGVKRRYELIYKLDDIPIICDYAHHPTEISSSLKGLLAVYKNPLVVFEPHTYSRTLNLFDKFVDVLSDFKNLIIYKTYPAREKEICGGRAIDLYNALNKNRGNKYLEYVEDISQLNDTIKKSISSKKCDVVVVLGAGELYNLLKYNN